MNDAPRINPLPFLLPGLLALLLALVAGLVRLPWDLGFGASLTFLHGPLMVSGFLGTVIAVERAAALRRGWAWFAPAANGLGALLLLFAAQLPPELPFSPQQAGALLFTLGAAGLLAIFAAILRLQPTLFNAVMTLGAIAYLNANLALLIGRPVATAVPLYTAFLLLTIAGERLELNRLQRPKPGTGPFFVIMALVALGGGMVAPISAVWADRALGFACFVLGAWLLMNDIARRTVRMGGVARFTAVCLIAGYVWLAVAGLSLLASEGAAAGLKVDATLHAFYVGFVLSMIFGHAPIVVPALLDRAVRFHGGFYLPLALLHASLLMRIGGDHAQVLAMRRWGGLLNVVALLLFLVILVAAVRRERQTS